MLNSFLFYSRSGKFNTRGEINLWSQITRIITRMSFILTMKCMRLSPTGLIPEYLNNPPRRKRYSETNPKDMPVILIIILANFIAGVMCIIAGSDHFETGGLNYQYIHNNKEYIRLLTYMFLHANVPHFVNNMMLFTYRFKT